MIPHRLNTLSIVTLIAMSAAGTAAAAGVVASGTQTQVNAVGNTPIVNIAGANGAGVSHNTFSNFDVDKNGVVFNNLTAAGASQLAGKLAANPNLNGNAARVIVADVHSALGSRLNGAMEVAGAPAHLLIANAAGISANGASVINAPVLTLAAAGFKPRADNPLALSVDRSRAAAAAIEIDGDGIDVGTGQLNLLSRATRVNGAVKGWTVKSQNGTDFDADAGGNFAGNAAAANGNAQTGFALDVSELGGMYANKIVLEGSEAGLGVNNAGVIRAGRGGVMVNLTNARVVNQPGSVLNADGVIAENVSSDRQAMNKTVDQWNAMHGWTPEVEAAMTDDDKRAAVAGLVARGSVELAASRARAETAKSAAEQEARAAQARAEQEARDRAAAQAAQEQFEADRHAADQARAEQEAHDRAAWEAANAKRAEQEAQDRAAWEAANAKRAEQEAQDRAAWEAENAKRAEQDARARAAWEAANPSQAAQQAQMEQEARNRAANQALIDASARAAAQARDRAVWDAMNAAQNQATQQSIQSSIINGGVTPSYGPSAIPVTPRVM